MALILALLETGSLFTAVSGMVFLWTRPILIDWIDVTGVLGQAFAVSLCCIVAFYYNDLYDLQIVRSFGAFASRLLQSFGVTFILLAVFYTLFPETRIAEGPFVSSLLIIVGFLLPLRAMSYAFMRSRPFMERLLILGTSPLAQKLIQEIEARPHFGYTIVGVADDAGTSGGLPTHHSLLGPLARLDKIVRETRPHRIIVALAERRGRLPVRELLEARLNGLAIEDGVSLYERLTGKLAIESLMPSFLIFPTDFNKSRLQLGLRRFVSLGGAALGLVVSAPLIALTALAIKLDSPGPVLFIQERGGLRGKTFRLIKFRTMRQPLGEERNSVWCRDDSSRITRLGWWLRKLRLDELPQFWNILKGDMDFVGPRPEMFCNVEAMAEQVPYYALRHAVRPGVTGWAQIKHGYSVGLEDVIEKIRYDLYYIKHMSLWLDLRILIDSVKIVLFGRGAR